MPTARSFGEHRAMALADGLLAHAETDSTAIATRRIQVVMATAIGTMAAIARS